MNRYATILAAFAFAATALPLSSGADPGERLSSSADAQQVNLTIYNGARSLVHDRRRVMLDAGLNTIAWRDVSGSMDATSALLTDVRRPGGAKVVEQNFDFDLLKPSTMLDKYVGRYVTVVHDGYLAGRPAKEQARLLSDNDGVVLQYRDRIETGLYNSHIIFPSIPGNLRDRPTLILQVEAARAGEQDLDLSYLTDGLSWHADYVGVVSPNEDHMHINGLVTLENTTGTSFPNARLQLVAGNVNDIVDQENRNVAVSEDGAPNGGVQQENYFEYHLYTLGRPTTVSDQQTKQVALLSAKDVPIHKTLELRGSDSYYSSASSDLGDKLKVGVYITFANEGGALGIPLPGGIFRLYKNDSHGTSQFLGSDTIDHTPRGQDVRLHVGDSFDVTANKKQTDFRDVGKCAYESSYKIAVSNAKDEEQNVLIVEPIPNVWTIPRENFHHAKTSSTTATWTLRVPPRKTTTLEYSAKVQECM